MKFTFLIICILGFQLAGSAQKFATGFGIGAHAANGIYLDSFDNKKTTSMRPGFKVFWMGRINLEGNINVSPEVGYSYKGFRVKNPVASVAEQELIMHYIDFKFIQEYTIKQKYYVKVGPGISVAFTGRDKQLSVLNVRSNNPIAFNFAAWGRFEGNVSFAVGTHFGGGWIAELTATRGITNIYDGDDGPNVKNFTYGVAIGKYLR